MLYLDFSKTIEFFIFVRHSVQMERLITINFFGQKWFKGLWISSAPLAILTVYRIIK